MGWHAVTAQSEAKNQKQRANRTETVNRQGSGDKPLVVVTGAAGKMGTALVQALEAKYQVIGLEL